MSYLEASERRPACKNGCHDRCKDGHKLCDPGTHLCDLRYSTAYQDLLPNSGPTLVSSPAFVPHRDTKTDLTD